MAMAERVTRWALGCAIACVVPLAIWSGGCGDKTVVEADAAADGGPSDATPPDMGTALQCCSENESNDRRCSSDGTGVEMCTYSFMGGQCAPDAAVSSGYGYVWTVSSCPNGCSPSGGTATCNP
ncbi:MAG TPA: hypothetical protein VGP07_22580 [Polyangia bacterium]|jgi:hypothetical protein